MFLQKDSEHPHLETGEAIGFVLAQLQGGRMTGWIHEGLTLEYPPVP
jgi:hypothetical protein